MTWTYDGAPGTDTADKRRDAVRLAIGDTDTNDQQVTDEEIAYALSEAGNNVYSAATQMCMALSAKFARLVDSSFGPVRNSYSQKSASYRALAATLESQRIARGGLGTPVAGGISIDAMDNADDDTDRPSPKFQMGKFQPETSNGVIKRWREDDNT